MLFHAAPVATPNRIEARLQTVGARKMVRELWGDSERWNAVIAGIESGADDWLQVASELKAGADAGQSEDLAIAVSRSIQRNAYGFLRVAFPTFGLRTCRDLAIEPSAAEHAHFQSSTRKALFGVTNTAVQSQRDACLAELEQGERSDRDRR